MPDYFPTQAPSMQNWDELRQWAEDEFRRVQAALLTAPVKFAALPAATTKMQGQTAFVTDSNTNVWGANIAGGGTNKVLAFCNGTAWTVAGK